MRLALEAIIEELHRLRALGVLSVRVTDTSLQEIRAAATNRAGASTVPPVAPAAPVVPAGPAAPVAPAGRAAPVVPVPGRRLPPPPVVALPPGDKPARWQALHDLVLADPVCQRSVRPGRKVVLGVGSLEAKILFVGEAPGAEEEIQGEPFVGPAGQLLTKMIVAMGLARSEVYIGNIMNWRPELPDSGGDQIGNRPPTDEEMNYCLPYLLAQIDVVQPQLLVALGATAARGLLGPGSFQALGDIRGTWREFRGMPLLVTYHPSYILRTQSNRSKRLIWEDLLRVMERAGIPISDRQRGFFSER